MQEIKFEPNVMCEQVDRKIPFRSSQVGIFLESVSISCCIFGFLAIFLFVVYPRLIAS